MLLSPLTFLSIISLNSPHTTNIAGSLHNLNSSIIQKLSLYLASNIYHEPVNCVLYLVVIQFNFGAFNSSYNCLTIIGHPTLQSNRGIYY